MYPSIIIIPNVPLWWSCRYNFDHVILVFHYSNMTQNSHIDITLSSLINLQMMLQYQIYVSSSDSNNTVVPVEMDLYLNLALQGVQHNYRSTCILVSIH